MIDELRVLVHGVRRRWFRAVALRTCARAFLGVAILRLLPAAFSIDATPGSVRVPAGTQLRIVARVGGRAGTLRHVVPELTLEMRGQARTVPMTPSGDGFDVHINAVDRSFTYRVRAGPAAQ